MPGSAPLTPRAHPGGPRRDSDVNHTFASMEADDPNPYLHKHREDAVKAWKIFEEEHMRKHPEKAKEVAQ